jgi:methyl-accepting chemotaxis protein
LTSPATTAKRLSADAQPEILAAAGQRRGVEHGGRNRRLFNDRVGLAAGRSTKKFLLQSYRRDMGGGRFVAMKDVSAPIVVAGRHWGGLRIAYKI